MSKLIRKVVLGLCGVVLLGLPGFLVGLWVGTGLGYEGGKHSQDAYHEGWQEGVNDCLADEQVEYHPDLCCMAAFDLRYWHMRDYNKKRLENDYWKVRYCVPISQERIDAAKERAEMVRAEFEQDEAAFNDRLHQRQREAGVR